MNAREKEDVVREICAEIDVPMIPLGRGSKERKAVFRAVIDRLQLPLPDGTKPALARSIVEHADLPWDDACESRGSTITTLGLERVLHAIRRIGARRSVGNVDAPSVGVDYAEASGGVQAEPRELLRDWDALDRATREHARLQNEVAGRVLALGYEPISPSARDPQFDLAWWVGESLWVCEIKSATQQNAVQQLRLGLGQLLEYRFLLQRSLVSAVRGVLVLTVLPRLAAGIGASAGVIVASADLSALVTELSAE